jgi:hypothetical protein
VGILLTFVAVAILALATSSTWWPKGTASHAAPAAVQVTTGSGVFCGNVAASEDTGSLTVSVGGRLVVTALTDVVSVQPVDTCP